MSPPAAVAASVLFGLLVVIISSLALSAEAAGSPRIIGGTNGTDGQFPWMCFLFIPKSSNVSSGFHCGANIINGGFHVLTAAHCFGAFNATNTSVLLITCGAGSANHFTPSQTVRGFQLTIHPQYNLTGVLENDIALLRVTPPFVLGNGVSTIPLATTLPKTGSTLYAAGWGLTNPAILVQPHVIEFTQLKLLSLSACTSEFGNIINSSKQICVGGNTGHDACRGDSGGPVFTTSNINAPTDAQLLGITSYGHPNCTNSEVFTRVPSFGVNWVNQQLSSVACRDGCNREFRYCKRVQTIGDRNCRSTKNRCINFCLPLQTLL